MHKFVNLKLVLAALIILSASTTVDGLSMEKYAEGNTSAGLSQVQPRSFWVARLRSHMDKQAERLAGYREAYATYLKSLKYLWHKRNKETLKNEAELTKTAEPKAKLAEQVITLKDTDGNLTIVSDQPVSLKSANDNGTISVAGDLTIIVKGDNESVISTDNDLKISGQEINLVGNISTNSQLRLKDTNNTLTKSDGNIKLADTEIINDINSLGSNKTPDNADSSQKQPKIRFANSNQDAINRLATRNAVLNRQSSYRNNPYYNRRGASISVRSSVRTTGN